MGIQIPFIVALIVMGALMLVFAYWTFGAATRSHSWQERRRQRG